MTDLLQTLAAQLGPSAISQISQQIGADPAATGTAVQAALPTLMSALANNAAKPEGAQALGNALQKNHDGSILDNLGNVLGGAGNLQSAGTSILGHVLGSRQPQVAQGIGQASGINAQQSGQLLAMLAPVVMGALGKKQREQGLDSAGLAQMLSGQAASAQQSHPAMTMLTSLLDSDNDGSIVDDLAEKGAGLLGGFLK